MIKGSVVNEPCPISAAGDAIVMVPSVPMLSQALGANVVCASASPVNVSGASVSESVRPAAVPRKSRRLMSWMLRCCVMAQPSRAARWMALMIRR